MSMKFIYQFDEGAPLVEITLSAQADLTEILESFKGFLQAATYQFKDGDYLEIVNDNLNEKEPHE